MLRVFLLLSSLSLVLVTSRLQYCYECLPHRGNNYCQKFDWWLEDRQECDNGICLKLTGPLKIDNLIENVVIRMCYPKSGYSLQLPKQLNKEDTCNNVTIGTTQEYTKEIYTQYTAADAVIPDSFLVRDMIARAQGLLFQRHFVWNWNQYKNGEPSLTSTGPAGESMIIPPWNNFQASDEKSFGVIEDSDAKTSFDIHQKAPGVYFAGIFPYVLDPRKADYTTGQWRICKCGGDSTDPKDFCNSSGAVKMSLFVMVFAFVISRFV